MPQAKAMQSNLKEEAAAMRVEATVGGGVGDDRDVGAKSSPSRSTRRPWTPDVETLQISLAAARASRRSRPSKKTASLLGA
jgi:hypothetical protein